MSNRQITLNKGSNKRFAGFWPSAPGSTVGADLTGSTLDTVYVSPQLQGRISLTITAPLAGRFEGLITWHEDMPIGAVMSFVIRRTVAGEPETLPEITVLVK